MIKAWRLLTARGRVLLILGLLVVIGSMFAGQRDVLRLGLLLVALPVVASILVLTSRLQFSCDREVEPAQAPLGTPMRGRLRLGQQGRLPIGLVLMEDQVPESLGTAPRFCVDKPGQAWQREIEYPLLGRLRGRFRTGPLTVRVADPFGLVRLDRRFVATSEVLVTPEIVPLPPLRGAGGAGSTGDARPHRVGVVGQDDVLVREYQQGDDVRRVHWRSTARRGELMVRREEQAWDPSATILLDSRADAHAGAGIFSSLEWAVSAAASIALHFVSDGYGIELYEANGSLHINPGAGQHPSATRQAVIDRLTDLKPRVNHSLRYGIEAAASDRNGQLVVAICGRLGVDDAEALMRLRRNRAQGMAFLLEVESFRDHPGDGPAPAAQHKQDLRGQERERLETVERMLSQDGWRVVRVRRGTGVAAAWSALDEIGVLV